MPVAQRKETLPAELHVVLLDAGSVSKQRVPKYQIEIWQVWLGERRRIRQFPMSGRQLGRMKLRLAAKYRVPREHIFDHTTAVPVQYPEKLRPYIDGAEAPAEATPPPAPVVPTFDLPDDDDPNVTQIPDDDDLDDDLDDGYDGFDDGEDLDDDYGGDEE